MKRRKAIGAAVGTAAVISGFLLYSYIQEPAAASLEYAHWSPNAAAIHKVIGTAAAPMSGMSGALRREQFRQMFKERFRRHDPPVAIGLRFITPTRIKLMCPARMEPFLIDKVALALWREARDSFGTPIEVDIYDTFIGSTQIKIGQLRAGLKDPQIAYVSYDFGVLEMLSRSHPMPTESP